MRIPEPMPAKHMRDDHLAQRSRQDAPGIEPAGCCAEVCVDLPIVGRVCHCALEAPFC